MLAAGSLLQYYFLGFDTIDNRPRSFLGHYMTASGLLMARLVLAAARLAFSEDAARLAVARRTCGRLALLAGALLVLSVLRASDLFAPRTPSGVFVALLAAAAALRRARRGGLAGPPARARCWRRRRSPLASWALLVSRTRNAWLGTLAGLAAIALLRAPRLLLAARRRRACWCWCCARRR